MPDTDGTISRLAGNWNDDDGTYVDELIEQQADAPDLSVPVADPNQFVNSQEVFAPMRLKTGRVTIPANHPDPIMLAPPDPFRCSFRAGVLQSGSSKIYPVGQGVALFASQSVAAGNQLSLSLTPPAGMRAYLTGFDITSRSDGAAGASVTASFSGIDTALSYAFETDSAAATSPFPISANFSNAPIPATSAGTSITLTTTNAAASMSANLYGFYLSEGNPFNYVRFGDSPHTVQDMAPISFFEVTDGYDGAVWVHAYGSTVPLVVSYWAEVR